MSEELNPCPFCGQIDERDLLYVFDVPPPDDLGVGPGFSVCCAVCCCSGPETDTRADAIGAWNRRAVWEPRPYLSMN